jgi:hypothetical protein
LTRINKATVSGAMAFAREGSHWDVLYYNSRA